MRKIQTIMVITGLLCALAASAAETPKGMKKIEPLPPNFILGKIEKPAST